MTFAFGSKIFINLISHALNMWNKNFQFLIYFFRCMNNSYFQRNEKKEVQHLAELILNRWCLKNAWISSCICVSPKFCVAALSSDSRHVVIEISACDTEIPCLRLWNVPLTLSLRSSESSLTFSGKKCLDANEKMGHSSLLSASLSCKPCSPKISFDY